MAETMLKAQASTAAAGTSNVPPTSTPVPPTAVNPSQDEEPAIELSSAPTFGFDDEYIQEVNKPNPSNDDLMMFEEEEESSGSQHSTFKPKEKKNKKKKAVVTRKEFLNLQAKVDQILAVVKPTQPPPEDIPGPQSLIEHIERLETRERMTAERISLKVEMGIKSLDNNRRADQ